MKSLTVKELQKCRRQNEKLSSITVKDSDGQPLER